MARRHPDAVRVGGRVQSARARRGWSQQQLADAVGVRPSTLSRYETGAREFPLSLVMRVADALRVRPDDLLAAVPTHGTESAEQLREVNARWEHLPGHVRATIVDMARMLSRADESVAE